MYIIIILWFANLIFQLKSLRLKFSLLEVLKQLLVTFLLIKISFYLNVDPRVVVAYTLSFTLLTVLTRYTKDQHQQVAWVGLLTHTIHFLGLLVVWYQFGFFYLVKVLILVLLGIFSLSGVFMKLILFPEKFEIKEKEHKKILQSVLSFCGFMPKVIAAYLIWILLF